MTAAINAYLTNNMSLDQCAAVLGVKKQLWVIESTTDINLQNKVHLPYVQSLIFFNPISYN
jgi:hypothetical protein